MPPSELSSAAKHLKTRVSGSVLQSTDEES